MTSQHLISMCVHSQQSHNQLVPILVGLSGWTCRLVNELYNSGIAHMQALLRLANVAKCGTDEDISGNNFITVSLRKFCSSNKEVRSIGLWYKIHT